MMNVGFLIAALLFDFVRQGLGEHGHLTLPLLGVKISTYRALFLVSLIIEISILPVLYLLRVGVEVTDEGMRITARPARERQENPWNSLRVAVRDSAKEPARLFAGLLRQAGVYRLLAFLILLSFLKLRLLQMYHVYPKF